MRRVRDVVDIHIPGEGWQGSRMHSRRELLDGDNRRRKNQAGQSEEGDCMKLELDIPDEDIVVCIRISGEPQAWLRTGQNKGRLFNPKENTDAREYVQLAIQARHPQFPARMDCVNRFGVAAIFETQLWDTDCDNYVKQLLDALQKFVFKNDRQVDKLFAQVERNAAKPNQQVIVYRVPNSLGGKQI
jgi:Holliday junction resolvase RusA-like endonuclease